LRIEKDRPGGVAARRFRAVRNAELAGMDIPQKGHGPEVIRW